MRTKDIVINFCISVAAAICFEVMKYTVDVLKGLPINSFYIFIIMMLVSTCIVLWSNLHGYKVITNKINIGGKEYYDIFEDIIYYQNNKPRNMLEIDKLKWNFDVTPNPQCNVFLDLHAEWEIDFTANQERIKKMSIGIHGGNAVSEESMNIEVYQRDSKVSYHFRREQDDCSFIDVSLNSHVQKGENDRITLKYDWEKFVIMDRKDDYIYLFPYSVANGMKQFELVMKHPYKCKAKVFLLKYKRGVEYDQIEVTDENKIKLKVEILNKGFAEEHKIEISDIGIKNIYLIIFEKEP